MPIRYLDPTRYNVGKPVAADADADWFGNNVAFTCPVCSKVFLVSGFIQAKGRICPGCGQSEGHCTGTAEKDGRAWIEWQLDEKGTAAG
jgi:hypothetical protein